MKLRQNSKEIFRKALPKALEEAQGFVSQTSFREGQSRFAGKRHAGSRVAMVWGFFLGLLLAFLLIPVSGVLWAAPGPFLQVGQTAPSVELKALTGEAQVFPASGKWSIVFFWSLFCHSCIEEMPMIADEVKKLDPQKTATFFVSLDTERMKKGLENFLRKRNLTLNVLLEEVTAEQTYRSADQWGVKTTPSAFLVSPTGEIRFAGEGAFDPEELLKRLRENLATEGSVSQSASPTATESGANGKDSGVASEAALKRPISGSEAVASGTVDAILTTPAGSGSEQVNASEPKQELMPSPVSATEGPLGTQEKIVSPPVPASPVVPAPASGE